MTPPAFTPAEQAVLASLRQAIDWTDQVVLGKSPVVRFSFACLLAQGHLLLDDLPGVGKTTLARTLARAMGLTFHRVQFTSDLLPSDIVGTSVFDAPSQSFQFHPGPIFAHLLLADEINRASPRTQSALLEAMAEYQVTLDGHTRPLPQPFFVMATQNPVDMAGTFPLPDSQLDRFLFRLALGYPDTQSELQLMRQDGVAQAPPPPVALRETLGPEEIQLLQGLTARIHAEDDVLRYALSLVQATRQHAAIDVGLSPRANLALMRAARAWALLEERSFVIPEDVQAVFEAVAGHRLAFRHEVTASERRDLLRQLREGVAV